MTTLDAEAAVVGAILIDANAYDAVSGIVTPDDFQITAYRAIFAAAKSLRADGVIADPVTIQDRSGASSEMIVGLMDLTPTSAAVETWARQVADHSRRRRLQDLAQHILDDAETDTGTLVSRTKSAMDVLMQETVSGSCVSSLDAAAELLGRMSERGKGTLNAVPTNFQSLDKMLGGGLINGGLYILAARPGMGKTSLALNVADKVNGAVLFVSLEMSVEQIMAKRLARLCHVPSHRILTGHDLTEAEWRQAADAAGTLSRSQVFINRRMSARVTDVETMARGIDGIRMIVVDYLGLLRPERDGSRYEAVTEISGALKRLALSMNIPILALSQLNRASEGRADKRPTLADLRDSGAVEQDADAVLLLHRPDYYSLDKQPGDASLVECSVAKNRHAATGQLAFNARLGFSLFWEV